MSGQDGEWVTCGADERVVLWPAPAHPVVDTKKKDLAHLIHAGGAGGGGGGGGMKGDGRRSSMIQSRRVSTVRGSGSGPAEEEQRLKEQQAEEDAVLAGKALPPYQAPTPRLAKYFKGQSVVSMFLDWTLYKHNTFELNQPFLVLAMVDKQVSSS